MDGRTFCGPGGLAWGAINADIGSEELKIQHRWASDFDKDTCETYRNNICPNSRDTVYQEDIKTLDIEKLEPIDVLVFGFPCNDFSQVGKQKGLEGQFGGLYAYAVKALKHFKPKWFVAENVPGLISMKRGAVFKKIMRELEEAGYSLTPHLFKFEDYGIPQSRHRLIVVGIRNDIDVKYLIPSCEPFENIDNSCKFALENPPIPSNACNHEIPKHSSLVEERLKHISPGKNVFSEDLPLRLQLKVKGARFSLTYRKLDPKNPSYTIIGSGGGGSHVYHWAEPRALTNRERARLQTFPDDFVFVGNRTSVRKQIGMAVPCQGAKIIFETILKCFAGIKYPSIPPSLSL